MNKIYQKPFSRGKTAGFTLIELLVVVLIIGILAAVALPQYQTAVDKARYSTMMSVVKALIDRQKLYQMENGEYTEKIEDLLDVAPKDCVKTSDTELSCQKFSLWLGPLAGNITVRNKLFADATYLQWYSGTRDCYAYTERGRRLCKSFGGVPYSEENAGCGGACTYYHLPI